MKDPEKVTSITALHNFLNLKRPSNPLISVFDFNEVNVDPETILSAVTTDFYVVSIKKISVSICYKGLWLFLLFCQ